MAPVSWPTSAFPNSVFSSPKRNTICAITVPPRVFLGSSSTLVPSASFSARHPALDVGGRRVERFALRNGLAALVILEQRLHVRRGRNLGAIRVLGGDELAQRAVRLFQIRPWPRAPHRPASPSGFRSRSRNSRRQSPSAAASLRLRPTFSESVSASSICFAMRALARSTSSSVGGCAAAPSMVFEQDVAGFVDRLVRAQLGGGADEAGVVHLLEIHPHRDRFLAFHQRLVEPAAGRFAHQLGQHVERGGIRMRAGGGVVDHHAAPGCRPCGAGSRCARRPAPVPAV